MHKHAEGYVLLVPVCLRWCDAKRKVYNTKWMSAYSRDEYAQSKIL